MRVAVVKFKDLKSWSVDRTFDDTSVDKYCSKCRQKKTQVTICENGKDEEVLFCHTCDRKEKSK